MNEVMSAPARTATGRPAVVLFGISIAGRAAPVALLAALPGLVVLAGFDHLVYGLGLLAGVVLAGGLIAPRLARLGTRTIPEALNARFGMGAAIAGALIIALVAVPLLSAELAFAGLLGAALLGVPYAAALIAALTLSVAAAFMLGDRGFARLAMLAYALLAGYILTLLCLLAFKAHGLVIPHIAYGQALSTVADLEERLIESGLVDFDTFSVHVAPFVRFTRLDIAALVVSLGLGTAVLPQLVSALTAAGRPADVRLAGAWSVFFVMLILISVPALAAYAKLEIYSAMAAGAPLADLPRWLEAPLRADLAHVHGTSLAMLDQLAKAVAAGGADPHAITDRLAIHAPALGEAWRALGDEARAAMVAAAQSPNGASAGELWQAYVGQVLPAAAAAAGDGTGTLSQAALAIEPAGVLLALPALSGAPGWILVAGLASALVVAAVFVRSLVALAYTAETRCRDRRPPWRACVLVLVLAAAAAAWAMMLRSDSLVAIVVSALSLGAAGLFPVLALGLAWRRATAAGAVAAILAGGAVTLCYEVGIATAPAAFYRASAPLSNAGEFAVEEFEALEAEARESETDEARAAAAEALDRLARGTAARAGLANWFGIDGASGAVFGVPVGFAVLVLVSLLTRRRGPATTTAHAA